MTLVATERFRRDYRHVPAEVRDQVDEALDRLLVNPRHPSLHFKKMQGTAGIWELRVSIRYRVTLQIDGEQYVLRRVGPHDVLRTP